MRLIPASLNDEVGKQAEIRKRAMDDEAERDKLMATSRGHEHRHHWLTVAATLLEIARSNTPRDAEWALQQLARIALAGEPVGGLELGGVGGI